MRGEAGHVFMAFEDDADFLETAAPLLKKGLERHEMVVYASDGDDSEVRRTLEGAAGGAELMASGQFVTEPLHRMYAAADDTSPQEALTAGLQKSLESAHARGLTGVRVFAISTQLASFSHWGRWEYEVGRQVLGDQLTAICAYDATAVDHQVLGDLASLHQGLRSRRPVTSFSLYPTPRGLALRGEVDAVSADRLRRSLDCVDPGPDSHLVIDVSELTFINHDGLLTIEKFARQRGLQIRLVGASGTLHRLHEILDLDNSILEVKP